MVKRTGLLILFVTIFNHVLRSQDWESAIKEAVRKNNTESLLKFIGSTDINKPFDGNINALVYAINFQSPKVVNFLLLNKANPNYSFLSQSPLMLAVQLHNISIPRMLLRAGASVNLTDSFGNTALMYASSNSNIKFVKLLVRHKASLNIRNKKGYNARDFAVRANNHNVSSYLRNVFEKNLPDYFDGPYVSFQGKRKIKVNYFKHDSLRHRTDSYLKFYNLKSLNGKFQGYLGDTNSYVIQANFKKPPSEQDHVQKLLMIGDIHGQYDSLKIFLQNNHVIDKKLNWAFGNGTVVFVGDIFDRGEKVTEALWLIYKMERQAAMHGGRVNLLLGNHEIMEMNDDQRFLSEKYYYIFNNLKLNYSKFYSNKTLMGRWLRSKNTFLRIDSFLFVHGGIHPALLDYKVSIDSVNNLVSSYLCSNRKAKYNDNHLASFLFSYNGPFWYRGMVEQSDGSLLSDEDVIKILQYFNVKYIVVGHTYHSELKFFNHGKIFSIDVAFYLPDGWPMQALLLEDQKLLILDSKGNRINLENSPLYKNSN